jgi:hypothetical protein
MAHNISDSAALEIVTDSGCKKAPKNRDESKEWSSRFIRLEKSKLRG